MEKIHCHLRYGYFVTVISTSYYNYFLAQLVMEDIDIVTSKVKEIKL
jgi:hypothetical protein